MKALEKNIISLERYFESHLLIINASKTEFIVFSKPRKNRVMENLKLEGQSIKATNSIEYLGVYLDRSLTFQEEVETNFLKSFIVYDFKQGIQFLGMVGGSCISDTSAGTLVISYNAAVAALIDNSKNLKSLQMLDAGHVAMQLLCMKKVTGDTINEAERQIEFQGCFVKLYGKE